MWIGIGIGIGIGVGLVIGIGIGTGIMLSPNSKPLGPKISEPRSDKCEIYPNAKKNNSKCIGQILKNA